MMRISLITLTALIACAHSSMRADATADLFTAITEQNVQNVAKALEMGADTDAKRSSDGLNAKAFSAEQINLICHTPVPLFVSTVSPLALIIASFLGNKQHACMSVAGIIAGASLSSYVQNTPVENHNFIQKIASKLSLDAIASYTSIAGLLASAWASERYALSSIGTAGLATLYYQGYKLKTACQIYAMVDPEHELIPELA